MKFRQRGFGLWLCLVVVCMTPPVVAEVKPAPLECTVILDQKTGDIVLRRGVCDQRFSPMSTFKLALALIGYDAGILIDEHAPTWGYRPEFDAPLRNRKPVDPTIWEKDSVVWFSQELTRKLGREKFADYVARFDYGNRDVTGKSSGEDGLTHAWLMSSLQISPDEQAAFLRRLLLRQLPVNGKALDMTLRIIPAFDAGDGWQVHGKTGSGRLKHMAGNQRLGWFVGWAEKDGHRVIFATMKIGPRETSESPGLALRGQFLKQLPILLKEK